MKLKSANTTIDKYIGARIRSRRMQLGLSQADLGSALDVSFQQVQKYEKGTNRISASRLQQSAGILQVPVTFFFEGAPGVARQAKGSAPSLDYVTDFLATRDGLALIKAFTQIKGAKIRRQIVDLVEQIADQ